MPGADRWTKAFKDPEFKELFNDYLEEISDPDARAETDAYLAQIERESKTGEIYGSDVELVVPEVAWCIEAREKSSKNGCYINVCTSPKVPPAKAGPKGAWEIPLNLGPMR